MIPEHSNYYMVVMQIRPEYSPCNDVFSVCCAMMFLVFVVKYSTQW